MRVDERQDDAKPSSSPDGAGLGRLLVLLCAALALVVAGNSALAIALPAIGADLGAGQGELTWIVDAYALTFAALLLPAGILADRVGRRTVLSLGLVVFGGACVASGLVDDAVWLILWRAVAGVGAAAVFPVTLSALVDAYPPERRGFAVAVWSAVSAAGAVAGTLVAGALLLGFWWGSVQVAFGAAALVLTPCALLLVAERRDPRLSLDPLGALLSATGLAALVYAVIEAPEQGWGPRVVAAAVLAAAALVAFVVHELRTAAPSLDVRAFTSPGLATGALIVSVQFFASLALFVLAPQYLQLVRGYGAFTSAAALLVIPVGVGLGTAVCSVLTPRLGSRGVGAAGLLGMAAGLAVLAAAVGAGRLGLLAAGLLVFGVGFGAAVTPGTVLILEGLPPGRRSVASAVNDITREVGGVLGIATLSSVLLAGYRSDVEPQLTGLPPGAAEAAGEGAGAALALADAAGPGGAVLAEAVRSAFSAGISDALWAGAAVLAVTAAVCLALGPRTHARRPSSDHCPTGDPR